MYRPLKIAISFICFSGLSALAQEENSPGDIITDRPDATESPNTVPVGYLQVEAGSFYERFTYEDIEMRTNGYATTLFRFGILKGFELRAGIDYARTETQFAPAFPDVTSSGLSPLLLGVKTEIAKEKGWRPEIGLLGHLYLPFTAASDFKPETTGVDFRFSFAHTLSERASLAYNLGAEWRNDSSEAAYVYTLAYGYSLTDQWGIYAELYGDLPEDSTANHFWDAGFTWLMQPHIQFDATVGTGITEGQELLLSAGVSFRIPN